MKLHEALEALRKEEKRKFEQSVDLLVNLKGIDMKRDQMNIIINVPHKIKEKRVCGFLTEKSKAVHTITEPEFKKYEEKKAIRKLIKDYDYFISVAKLMPKVAMAFGKVLGPSGKMPSPQLGILMQESEEAIKKELQKISTSIKVRLKEASIKIPIGKENMSDSMIMENIQAAYKAIENGLPKKKDNIRNVMVKFSMTKPLKVELE
jgi:large subunit ribosomal protein L1